MESELDPVVSTSANAPAGASPGARFLVGLALVACWLTVLAPLSAIAAFFVVIMLFLAALFTVAAGFILELLSDALNTVGKVRPYVVRERLGGGHAQ